MKAMGRIVPKGLFSTVLSVALVAGLWPGAASADDGSEALDASDGSSSIGYVYTGINYDYDDYGYTGWKTIDEHIYYYIDGEPQKGLVVVDGATYYFDESNRFMVADEFQEIGNRTYYFGADGKMSTLGYFETTGKETRFVYADGSMAKGFATLFGEKYYFDKNGVRQTGLKRINGKRYFFDPDSDGQMATSGILTKGKVMLIVSYTGVCYKRPAKTGNKTKDSNRMAKLLAKCTGGKKYWKKRAGNHWQLAQVYRAASYVATLASRSKYTYRGDDYYTPYGVFYAKKYTCAGTASALKLVVTKMGYKAKHVNKGKNTHQWLTLKMDGKKGYADAFPTMQFIGFTGYGKHPVAR